MVSVIKNFAITFCVSIIIFGLIAYFISGFLIDSMGLAGNGFLETKLIETTPTSDISPDTTGENSEEPNVDFSALQGSSFTVMLVGTDYQPDILKDYDLKEVNKTVTGFPMKERKIAADTVMVVHINKERGKIVYCPLPSNMKVTVDGLSIKLSEVYSKKGIEYLKERVSSLIGMKIEYYAVTTIPNMAKLIDTIGGLSLYVPQKMSYSDSLQDLSIDLSVGTQTLYGDKTLQFLRFDQYTASGFDRNTTAISVVKAILTKLTSSNYYNQVNSLMTRMKPYVDTNFTEQDLADNLELIFAYSDFTAVDYVYPGSETTTDGVKYFEPSTQTARNFFLDYKFKG